MIKKPQPSFSLEDPLLPEKIDFLITCFIYLDEKFTLKNKQTDIDSAIIFFKSISKKIHLSSVGTNYIFNYVTYTFMNSRIKKTFSFKVLLSPNSRNNWFDKPDDWYVWHSKFLSENGLKKPAKENQPIDILKTEDSIRRKYYGTRKGFILCLESTSLHDPKSEFCQRCLRKNDCREVLKTNNPPLYKLRNGIKS